MKRAWRLLCVIAFVATGCATTEKEIPPVLLQETRNLASQTSVANSLDFAEPEGLPRIGKWMVDSHGEIAHWLGYRFHDRRINEPINIIIRVATQTEESANERLLAATEAAGFKNRKGHSSGYSAYLSDGLVPQFPPEPRHAFSDRHYCLPNSHGRLFGPVLWNGAYYYVGAFSRENIAPLRKLFDHNGPAHTYSSFNRARDKFVERMSKHGGARMAGTVSLGNAIVDDPAETTGDHDGLAVLLDL